MINRMRVSSLLDSFEKPFEKEKIAKMYARKNKLDVNEVIAMWDKKGKDARFAGVFMEDVIVKFYKDYFPTCLLFQVGHPYHDSTHFEKSLKAVRKERVQHVNTIGVMYGEAGGLPSDLIEAEYRILDRYLDSVGVLKIPYNKIIGIINGCLSKNMLSLYPDYLSPPLFQREVSSGNYKVFGNYLQGHLDLCFTSKNHKQEATVIELKCSEIKLPPQYNERFLDPFKGFYKCNVYRYLMQTYLYCKMLQIEGYKKCTGLLLFYSRERELITGITIFLDKQNIIIKCADVFNHLQTDMYKLLYHLQSLFVLGDFNV